MRYIIFITTIAFSIVLSSCSSKKTEAKNLEQIYAEQGIPVKVEKVSPKPFKKTLYYNAIVRGYRESSAFAAIGDRVEKIYVKVGDYVEKDQVLLTFPTDNPAAQYYQAKVAFQNAERLYKRMQQLLQNGGISQQDLDNAKMQYEVARANWDAVKKAVKVKAPISGYVTKINVHETDNVDVKAELFTITQTNRMKAEIWVSENEIEQVKEGQPAIARWNGVVLKGKLVQVNMAMDLKHRAFKALLEFDNPENRFKSGVTARIELVTVNEPEAIVVDRTALIKEGNQYFVYLNKNGQAKKQMVKIGSQNGSQVLVVDGLKPGEELIVEGQQLVKDGSKLNIIG